MLSENISRDPDGTLRFAGHSVTELAARYGTPLYLFDEERIRANCRMYKEAFRKHFGAGSLPLYASKAASFKEMYRIMADEGMGVDAVSSGEIHTALAAGFPAERIMFHGDGKTDEDIIYALEAGVGRFVVDNPEELAILNEEALKRGMKQDVLLRITPGIDPHTYAEVNTGSVDVKFGIHPVATGSAMVATLIPSSLGLTNYTFALTILYGWIMAVMLNPLSAQTLILSGESGRSNLDVSIRSNWLFCLVCTILFSLLIPLFGGLLG